ncbi:hypothetical protein T12_3477 [Trichinella patagoniensis]|uniref:Uncharacterized protein n=1 Tax=Trichinella patagoniensis TaxID=990121 RepID=A0A0V0ZEU8_9BILA|nr:hypothetical protein T12_3477 [Trichinella patagoniensis]
MVGYKNSTRLRPLNSWRDFSKSCPGQRPLPTDSEFTHSGHSLSNEAPIRRRMPLATAPDDQ